ncbi:MAG: hypothetical protein OXH00_05295 [Candidatus Poribacteria bacterium]|nr:hypothetical protein [Candidatus Poribacteria bacterium]
MSKTDRRRRKLRNLLFLLCLLCLFAGCDRIQTPTQQLLLHPHEDEEPMTHPVHFQIPVWLQETLWENEEQLIRDLLNLELRDREEIDRLIEAIRTRREQSEDYTVFVDVDGMALIGTRYMSTRIEEMANIMLTMTQKHPEIRKELHYDTGFYFVIFHPRYYIVPQLPEWRSIKELHYPGNTLFIVPAGICDFNVQHNLCIAPSKVFDNEFRSWGFKNSWEVAIHEFGHAIDYAIRKIDPSFEKKLNRAYENAKEKGLWTYYFHAVPNSPRDNPKEYWALGIEAWFVGKNETTFGKLGKSPALTKGTLSELDPLLYELLDEWLPYVDLEP